MHDAIPSLPGKRVILGITGSIAAYKAVGLLRALMREGATVSVVMTDAATRFVTPLTFEVLSGHAIATDLFSEHQEMVHLTWPSQADVMVIAPATANSLAKLALGLADDLLSTMALTRRIPLVVAPAMDGDMWAHPTVIQHVRTLRERGTHIVEPEEGALASGRIGHGRLATEQHILRAIQQVLFAKQDWHGRRVLVSAGPTEEAIDPVRFLSNRSSGKMGYAIATAARDRGSNVVLVSGPTSLPKPAGVELVSVTTAEEMEKALLTRLSWADTVIMAAAVADFRPKRSHAQKIKKSHHASTTLQIEPTVDILHQLALKRSHQTLVGFAAETTDLLAHAREKLHAKHVDLIVANDVSLPGGGFGSDLNAALLVGRGGLVREVPLMPKRALADVILDTIAALPQGKGVPSDHSRRRQRT